MDSSESRLNLIVRFLNRGLVPSMVRYFAVMDTGHELAMGESSTKRQLEPKGHSRGWSLHPFNQREHITKGWRYEREEEHHVPPAADIHVSQKKRKEEKKTFNVCES
jgi:hypothetical protein